MDDIEKIASSVLYEGYRLFPYSPTSIKNTRPSLFGVVYPEDYNEHDEGASSYMQTECIIQGSDSSILNIDLRFLQLKEMIFLLPDSANNKEYFFMNSGKHSFSMHGYLERKVQAENLRISELIKERQFAIEFGEESKNETLQDMAGKPVATCISKISRINGSMSVLVSRIEEKNDLFKIRVRIANVTPVKNSYELNRESALRQALLSTHLILRMQGGIFVSQTDPSDDNKEIVKECRNVNMWPVLARRENDVMLSSPIILYDYPEIAPESTGDFFDSTEIEEYLLLHIALLSKEERERFSQGDEKLRSLFENVKEIKPEQMLKLHGRLRFTKSDPHDNNVEQRKRRE